MKRVILCIQTQGREPREHWLASDQTLIGRSVKGDLCIDDSGISREHAVITWDGEECVIEDLQSTNGTQVNGKRIRSSALGPGDEITLGRTRIVLQVED